MDQRDHIDDWPVGAVLGSTLLDDVGVVDGALLWPTGHGVHLLVDSRRDIYQGTGFML
jgi:hypothetical protein